MKVNPAQLDTLRSFERASFITAFSIEVSSRVWEDVSWLFAWIVQSLPWSLSYHDLSLTHCVHFGLLKTVLRLTSFATTYLRNLTWGEFQGFDCFVTPCINPGSHLLQAMQVMEGISWQAGCPPLEDLQQYRFNHWMSVLPPLRALASDGQVVIGAPPLDVDKLSIVTIPWHTDNLQSAHQQHLSAVPAQHQALAPATTWYQSNNPAQWRVREFILSRSRHILRQIPSGS